MNDFIRSIVRQFAGSVAARLAVTMPIRCVPGWWSGMASQGPVTFDRQIRRRFWHTLAGTPAQIRWYDGLKLEVVLGSDLSHCLYVDGEIDPNEFSFLAQVLKPGMMVIDGGANEGVYSVFCRSKVGAQGRVLAVEPSMRERMRIERNKSLNGFEDIEILPLALSEQVGSVVLQIAEDEHAGHNTLGHFAASWVHAKREEIVPSATLDGIAAAQGLRSVDLIKLDIEGAELRALRGAEELLRRDHPALLMEVMEETLATQGASASQLLDYVRQFGYSVFEFSPLTGHPVPLMTPELQLISVIALHPEGSITPYFQEHIDPRNF
ncbi:MAG TPA: FkbM family methyltransferase [Candidatus Binataceae bacterium]|nr:FkbM family methyltransferase [Candidatus Binataceae bacterium]